MTTKEKFDFSAGLDNSPGSRTWTEWKRQGLTREDAERVAPNKKDAERFSELDRDDFCYQMDKLWGDRCMASEVAR